MVRVAPIDIGTVSVRLAVADVEGGRVLRCAKQSRICDLGEGLSETGALSDAACARVLAAVDDYLACARAAGASFACCTLTSAARDAENSRELGAALDSLGLDPLIIPGEVEGALTFLGVARDFPGRTILVADNGGGSTELALGSLSTDGALELRFVRSVDVGCRRLTERFLSEGPLPSADDLVAAHNFAAERLAPAVREGGLVAAGAEGATDAPPEVLVVTGGTVTSLVAVEKGLEPYDPSQVHLAELTREQVGALERRLAALTVEGRAELAGLQPQRAPVILGGTVAVAELLGQTGFSALTVSESDLLFGLAALADGALAGAPSPVGWAPSMRPLR